MGHSVLRDWGQWGSSEGCAEADFVGDSRRHAGPVFVNAASDFFLHDRGSRFPATVSQAAFDHHRPPEVTEGALHR